MQHRSLLLIHGACCDARMWDDVVRFLGQRQPALAVPLAGFRPDETLPDTFSSEAHVRSLLAAMEEHGPGKVIFAGHSRGARLALAAAARVPHRVEALVLAEAGGAAEPAFLVGTSGPAVDAAGLKAAIEGLLLVGRCEEAVVRYVDAGQGAGFWHGLPPALRAVMLDNAHTIPGTRGDPSCPLARSALASLRCPVLLMEGADSPSAFHRIADVVEVVAGDVQRVRFPGQDHFFPSRDPARFAGTMLNFIEGRASR